MFGFELYARGAHGVHNFCPYASELEQNFVCLLLAAEKGSGLDLALTRFHLWCRECIAMPLVATGSKSRCQA